MDLQDIFRLSSAYLDVRIESQYQEGGGEIPEGFLKELLENRLALEKRFQSEYRQSGFIRDLQKFFEFVRQTQDQMNGFDTPSTVDSIMEKVLELGQRYGVDLEQVGTASLNESAAEKLLMPISSDSPATGAGKWRENPG